MSDTTALYVSRPQQVEAIQWTGDIDAIKRSPFRDVALAVAWTRDGWQLSLRAGKDGAQGWVLVPLGHWLVRNPGDPSDNWPVDPDHFAATYDRAAMSDTTRGYVNRCWLRGRVPDRLHRLWHLRRLGRAAWHASKFMNVPCRVTHRDIERARQLIKAHQALWTK